jgi:hypothetical protein
MNRTLLHVHSTFVVVVDDIQIFRKNMKGQCNACDARAQLMCTGCYGVFYCSEECHLEDVDRHNHQVPVCQQAGKNVPAIVGTARDRIGVIRLLNSFTEESIREAIERLSMVENVSAPFGHRVTIIMTDDDETEIPCRLYDRACTDGLTLWISRLMLTHKVTNFSAKFYWILLLLNDALAGHRLRRAKLVLCCRQTCPRGPL